MSNDGDYKYYIHKGKEVPRVSDYIKLIAKDQLILWANYLGFKRLNYNNVIESEAYIGTFIHDYIEHYLDGNDNHKFEKINFRKYGLRTHDEVEKAINGAISFLKFYSVNKNFKIVEKEIVVTNSYMGGRIDSIIESPFNKDHVIINDYKTSKDFYVTMFLQLVAYYILYTENRPGIIVDGIMITLMDKKDGKKAKIRYYPIEDILPLIETFLALVQLHKGLRTFEKIPFRNDIFR